MSARQEIISCEACHATGTIVWEELNRPSGATKELVWMDDVFYERLSKKPPYPIEIVCRACNKAWVSPLQP